MTIAMNVPSRPALQVPHPGEPRLGGPDPAPPVLRRVPLPASEPPFDDELGYGTGHLESVPERGRIHYRRDTPTATRRPPTSEARSPLAAGAPLPAGVPPAAGVPLRAGVPLTTGAGRPARTESRPAGGSAHLRLIGSPAATRTTGAAAPAQLRTASHHLRVLVDSAATRSRLFGGDESETAFDPPTPVAPMPDPRPLATQVVQAVAEILAGDRMVTQLTSWVDEEVYAAVAAAAPAASTVCRTATGTGPPARVRPQDRPLVRSVHLSSPTPGVTEVSARVQTGPRSRAVALRLEQWRGRWRCNALTVG